MKLDETKLQEVVEKIAYQQFGAEQIDDLYAKMGILNDYVQEQLRLFAVVGRSEQFISLIRELIDVGIIDEDDIEVETWVNNYLKEIN
ncbi:MAG: hypothetical protein GX963_09230 [Bacteroidales bacterium]|nr:hypothetical protein [Bacteroidales bacterium]